ncbi:MAG: hypothetical protein JNM34_01105 [Chthonomonadaceae bacterium]|jgi:hypothetical protein|nr:hypothetical protein [Chthonomonadaceae bacterium]
MTAAALVFSLCLVQSVPSQPSVKIVTTTSDEMFPASWRKDPVNAGAQELEKSEVSRSIAIVSRALALYPNDFLEKELKTVYVCKSIKFYGLSYGGTNSLDAVYLTNQGSEQGYTDKYIFGSFHHEFSSVLLRNHPDQLDARQWSKSNPVGFRYGDGGTEALRSGKASTEYEATLAKRGFLTEYSQASLEEDFNMIVEGMFSGDPVFWQFCGRFPKLAKKQQLAAEFYRKLVPGFTSTFFRSRPRFPK